MHASTPLLIGLAGRARSGKDTVGQRLCETHGLWRLAFADPIKDMVAAMLNVDRATLDDYPKEMDLPALNASLRKVYQTLGTEWGREFIHRDVWVRLVARQWDMARRNGGFSGAVITDVRMCNEASWIRQQGGVVIHVEREQREAVRTHISEMPLPVLNGDYRLSNNGTLDELYQRVADVMRLIMLAQRQQAQRGAVVHAGERTQNGVR